MEDEIIAYNRSSKVVHDKIAPFSNGVWPFRPLFGSGIPFEGKEIFFNPWICNFMPNLISDLYFWIFYQIKDSDDNSDPNKF